MRREKSASLTVLRLVGTRSFAGTTETQALVARFCEAVLSGRQPNARDAVAIAEALLPIVQPDGRQTAELMHDVAERLGVLRKPGKALAAEMQARGHANAVADYLEGVEMRIAAGEQRREAELGARREIAERLGIGDRAMRDRIRKHHTAALALLELRENLARLWESRLEA